MINRDKAVSMSRIRDPIHSSDFRILLTLCTRVFLFYSLRSRFGIIFYILVKVAVLVGQKFERYISTLRSVYKNLYNICICILIFQNYLEGTQE